MALKVYFWTWCGGYIMVVVCGRLA
jgi:hypothetical protein